MKMERCVSHPHESSREYELFEAVRREDKVPKDRVDAVIVSAPLKGELSVYDNWRGISLQDVAGKVFARVIQQWLQAVYSR